jgi:hypothetical protein
MLLRLVALLAPIVVFVVAALLIHALPADGKLALPGFRTAPRWRLRPVQVRLALEISEVLLVCLRSLHERSLCSLGETKVGQCWFQIVGAEGLQPGLVGWERLTDPSVD